jgi:hypothetical protein
VLARLLVVVVLAVAVAAGDRLYRRWRRDVEGDAPQHPVVPSHLLEGAARTWVVFTTPYCATCGPVEASLRASDPAARVVKVDATRHVDLANAFAVRAAPTAVLADADGRVTARLVGAEAVDRYVRNPA